MSRSDRGGGQPTVLVVEDEEEVQVTYELWLTDEYEVLTASDGEEALEKADDSVDVVLLDRLMPGLSGKEVLAELRDRDLPCRVAMVTAVEPDFDIIELGFDDYVVKPPSQAGLKETIEDLLDRQSYGETLDRYTSLLAKREALRERKSDAELDDSEEFADLEAELAELEAELEEADTGADDDAEFVSSLRAIEDEAGGGD